MMTKFTLLCAGAATVALFATAPAAAQTSRATKVNGAVTQTAQANVIATTIVGSHSTGVSGQNVVFEESEVNGSLTQTAKANVIATTIVGSHSHGTAGQNMIGAPKPGR
jgi:hypothetical protein